MTPVARLRWLLAYAGPWLTAADLVPEAPRLVRGRRVDCGRLGECAATFAGLREAGGGEVAWRCPVGCGDWVGRVAEAKREGVGR